MFDENSLKKIDTKYFNIILMDDRDITIQSRNTGHYWYLHCTEYPMEQSLIIFHKHFFKCPYHQHDLFMSFNYTDIELHFAYRARQEKKKIILSGSDYLSLFCDRDWLSEAIDNIVKNAFDHTENGAVIGITWRALPSGVQIVVKDNGCGIHPEDLHHIFKRFYRSRFSKDTQGIGLGLPLAKAAIEAHGGAIEVDSELGRGTSFTMNFLIPTKL